MSRHERQISDTPGVLAEAGPPPAAPPGKKRRRAYVVGIAGLVVLGLAAWFGGSWWTTGRFLRTTDDAYVTADITMISARVDGYVAGVGVGSNDHVSAGDVLVRLDDGDFRNALAAATSRWDTAGRTLARIDAQIEAARAAVTQAEAARDTAAAKLRTASTGVERARRLTASNVSSQAQLDAATEDFDVARAGLASAEAAIASAEAQVAVLGAQRAEAEGQRTELKVAVDQAQRNLDLTVLAAPADGIVANMTLEPGDLVTPGARLAALVLDDSLYVEANLKETQLDGVAPGASVEMSFDALPGRSFTGRVVSVSPATGAVFSLLPADNATGNFTKIVQRVPVRISIPPEALATGALRAGLSSRIAIDTRSVPGAGTGAGAAE